MKDANVIIPDWERGLGALQPTPLGCDTLGHIPAQVWVGGGTEADVPQGVPITCLRCGRVLTVPDM